MWKIFCTTDFEWKAIKAQDSNMADILGASRSFTELLQLMGMLAC